MDFTIAGYSKRDKFIASMLPSMLSQLKLGSSKRSLMVKVTVECEHEGSTTCVPEINAYLVLLKPATYVQMALTLAHELVHVKQFATGKLKAYDGGHVWSGSTYPDSTPYLDQPWEVQAYAKQEIIMRRSFELDT
jgi:hypothetical protein